MGLHYSMDSKMDSDLKKEKVRRMGKDSVIDCSMEKPRETHYLREKVRVTGNLKETMKDWRYLMARDWMKARGSDSDCLKD